MKKKMYKWYRHPRTTAEAKANQNGWGRAKRRSHNLPSSYDDLCSCYQKTWKVKRKKQYRVGKRGQKHSIKVYDWSDLWKLKDYCEDHDIPHDKQEIRRFRWVKEYVWVTTNKLVWNFWKSTWEYDKERKWNGKYRRSYYTDHYIFTWWSNKDIGVEYILKNGSSSR